MYESDAFPETTGYVYRVMCAREIVPLRLTFSAIRGLTTKVADTDLCGQGSSPTSHYRKYRIAR
jgi:hypothetical protein